MSRERVAGWSAIAFVVTIVGINLTENIGTSRPDPAATPQEMADWATHGDPYLWATTVFVPIAWILLVVFAANLWTWARSAGIDLLSPTIGLLGSAMTMGTLSAAIAADAVLITSIDNLTLELVEVLTGFTTVLFLLNWVALAIALYGLSRTTMTLGLAPQWLGRLSLAGVGLLVVGSVQSAPVLNGILPGVLFGFAGFVIWLLYLAIAGIRLVRNNDSALQPEPSRT